MSVRDLIEHDEGELLDANGEHVRKNQEIHDGLNALELARKEEREKLAFFSGGRDFDKELVTVELQQHVLHGTVHLFEAGKRLVWAKECMDHGEWAGWLEENFPFSLRTAQLWMRAAYCVAANPRLRPLAETSIVKVAELARLSEPDLAELEEDGTLLGRDLDDLDRMSVRQLKQLVRDEKAGSEALGDELSRQDKEIERLKARVTEAEYSRYQDTKKLLDEIAKAEAKMSMAWAYWRGLMSNLDLSVLPPDLVTKIRQFSTAQISVAQSEQLAFQEAAFATIKAVDSQAASIHEDSTDEMPPEMDEVISRVFNANNELQTIQELAAKRALIPLTEEQVETAVERLLKVGRLVEEFDEHGELRYQIDPDEWDKICPPGRRS